MDTHRDPNMSSQNEPSPERPTPQPSPNCDQAPRVTKRQMENLVKDQEEFLKRMGFNVV